MYMGKVLTIRRLPVFVPLGSANLTKCGEDVINALGELVGDIKDRSTDETSTFDGPQIRVCQIVLMDNRTPCSGGPNPHHFPSLRTREQHVPEVRAGTADDPDGSNYDTVEKSAFDHVAFMYRSPSYKRVGLRSRGGIGDDFVAIVAVNPSSRCFHVSELRDIRRAGGFHGLGYQVEDLDSVTGGVGRSGIDDRVGGS